MWLALRALAAALLVGGQPIAAWSAQAKPNVVLIVTDDQGWWDLSCHGNPHLETPVLDRLAAEGVEFTRFYASPVCTPTRAALMTGRHYQRTGAVDTFMGRDVLGADEITIAQILQQQGYRTGQFGKWHLGRYMRYHPNRRGFDEFFGFWQYGYINRYFDSDELFHNRDRVVTTGYITDVLTDAAIDFVRDSRGRPFFLYLPYNAPHSPYLAPDPLIEKYLKKGLPLREARIAGMVDSLDANIGRLLAAVDHLGLRQDTVVIFMSDNGGVSQQFKAGLRGSKASVYEGGIRVPFFVRWPGQFPAGAKIEAMAQHIDILPTLCELTGAPVPGDRPMDGRSLLSLLRTGSGATPHEYLFHQWNRTRPNPNANWAVHAPRYKLANGELFDLQNDLGERTNLAAQHPEMVAELRAAFEKWFAEVTAGQEYARVPIEVGREDENPVETDIAWAELVGGGVKYEWGEYHRDRIANWTDPSDSLRWKIDVLAAGRYEVVLSYGSHRGEEGSSFRISAGDGHLDGVVESRTGPHIFQSATVGTIDLAAGPAVLEIKPLRIAGKGLMTLHSVRLRRLP